MNYRMISYVSGWILLFEAAFLLVPSITALVYLEMEGLAFLATIGICLLVSVLLILKKPKNTDLHSRDGFVIVSLSWIMLSLFGALPFVFSGVTNSYIDAFFETVSGFTTTGASIFPTVEALPKCVLIWRSFSHWVGGMGVLVFIMAFLPLSGGRNMHIMKAESPGPSVSKLVPRVRTTALWLYGIYFVLSLIMFIVLLCGGMPAFEALCTTFGTAGTGGFSVLNSGMNGYAPALQIIISVFMLIFAINFETYFALIQRKWRDILSSEVIVFCLVVASAVGIITWNLYNSQVEGLGGSLADAARHAFFTVSSLISTTGFSTVDYDLWPALSTSVLMLLFFIGACAGSTGGGIKVSRILILFKSITREIGNSIHPKRVKKITVDKKPVEQETVHSVLTFLGCFAMLFAASLLLLSIDGKDFPTNFSAVASAIGNVGPGFSGVGPTKCFADFSVLSKLVLCFDMLAGRLEIFPMLVLFSPATWRKY